MSESSPSSARTLAEAVARRQLVWGPALQASLGLVLLALVVGPLFNVSNFYLQLAFVWFINAALAESWNILGGYGGYYSFGHAAFYGLGGYTVAVLFAHLGWSPFLTAPLGALVAALAALLIGAIGFHTRGAYFIILTISIVFVVQSIVLNLRSLTQGSMGIRFPFFMSDRWLEPRLWYYLALVLVIGTALIARWVERSRFGLNLKAIREDEDVSAAMGVNVFGAKLLAFMLSAGLAGLVGAIATYHAYLIDPEIGFALLISVNPVLMAVLGGTRSWPGPLIGAVIMSGVSDLLAFTITSEFNAILFGLVLALAIIFFPQGILGVLRGER